MMKVIITILCLLAIKGSAYALIDSVGVYKTSEDFKNKKLSYVVLCHGWRNKIRTHDCFGRHYITVTYNRKKERINKSDIYGYRGCDKNDYRIFENSEYTIVNTNKFYLYTKTIQEPGDSGYCDELYFFSLKPDSKIVPMNKQNLMTAFKDNKKFVNLIDLAFKKNEDLSISMKQYFIIKLYEQSLE